jgi:hypothetical protein
MFHYFIFDNLLIRYRNPIDFITIMLGAYGIIEFLFNIMNKIKLRLIDNYSL